MQQLCQIDTFFKRRSSKVYSLYLRRDYFHSNQNNEQKMQIRKYTNLYYFVYYSN